MRLYRPWVFYDIYGPRWRICLLLLYFWWASEKFCVFLFVCLCVLRTFHFDQKIPRTRIECDNKLSPRLYIFFLSISISFPHTILIRFFFKKNMEYHAHSKGEENHIHLWCLKFNRWSFKPKGNIHKIRHKINTFLRLFTCLSYFFLNDDSSIFLLISTSSNSLDYFNCILIRYLYNFLSKIKKRNYLIRIWLFDDSKRFVFPLGIRFCLLNYRLTASITVILCTFSIKNPDDMAVYYSANQRSTLFLFNRGRCLCKWYNVCGFKL